MKKRQVEHEVGKWERPRAAELAEMLVQGRSAESLRQAYGYGWQDLVAASFQALPVFHASQAVYSSVESGGLTRVIAELVEKLEQAPLDPDVRRALEAAQRMRAKSLASSKENASLSLAYRAGNTVLETDLGNYTQLQLEFFRVSGEVAEHELIEMRAEHGEPDAVAACERLGLRVKRVSLEDDSEPEVAVVSEGGNGSSE